MDPPGLRRCVLALALALVVPLGCRDRAKIAELERQKATLEATTVPKAEFWAQVARKGAALQRQKTSESEASSLREEITALRSQRGGAVAAELTRARAMRETAEGELRTAQAELARAERERSRRAAALQGFEARRREGAGS